MNPECDLCNYTNGPLTKVPITSTNWRYLCRGCAVAILHHFNAYDLAHRDAAQIHLDRELNAGLSSPFTATEEQTRAVDELDACLSCGNTFGPLYGEFTVTCAVCNRPWRTRRMAEMDAKLREVTP